MQVGPVSKKAAQIDILTRLLSDSVKFKVPPAGDALLSYVPRMRDTPKVSLYLQHLLAMFAQLQAQQGAEGGEGAPGVGDGTGTDAQGNERRPRTDDFLSRNDQPTPAAKSFTPYGAGRTQAR